jgi:hypothetical protein
MILGNFMEEIRRMVNWEPVDEVLWSEGENAFDRCEEIVRGLQDYPRLRGIMLREKAKAAAATRQVWLPRSGV